MKTDGVTSTVSMAPPQSTDLDAMATTRRQGRAKVGQGPEGLAIHAQQHVAGLDARTGGGAVTRQPMTWRAL